MGIRAQVLCLLASPVPFTVRSAGFPKLIAPRGNIGAQHLHSPRNLQGITPTTDTRHQGLHTAQFQLHHSQEEANQRNKDTDPWSPGAGGAGRADYSSAPGTLGLKESPVSRLYWGYMCCIHSSELIELDTNKGKFYVNSM